MLYLIYDSFKYMRPFEMCLSRVPSVNIIASIVYEH